ncbi:LacI family DNA-binding transcriptional regulator [Aestuariibius sp. 2305UL40-4]|uniref:LacI family DNA-binding transcriptional regulator n=1 Tax=Aestuariibius violaceus TaxID=3234132 RepID=UPI00345EF73A
MRKRIGLKTLAAELGVDVSTVSRALRDDPRVKSETRRAVRDLARHYDYRPNAAARALRGGKSGRVAVLLSPPQQRFASPIFLELLSTLDQQLRDEGLNLAVFAARARDEEAEIVRQIVDEGLADALVLGRTRKDDPRVRYLLDVGVPFITFGTTDWIDQHPTVEIDYAHAGRLAIRALAAERIHILSAPEGLNFADNYVRGAVEEAASLGLPAPQIWRIEMTEEVGAETAARILADGGRPAFACIQDSLAFGVFGAAAALDLAVGRDLTVFGGQNFPGSEYTAPPLSTFSTEDRRVADLLSQVMLRHLEANGARPLDGYEHHEIQPTPLLRQSHKLVR